MRRSIHLSLALVAVLVLGACSSNQPRGCMLPPGSFSNADLVGTWFGLDGPGDSSLTIRGDARYKQTLFLERTGFRYEGDWKPWRLTYSGDGLPYLHLEGFLMCAYWNQIDCQTGQTGFTPFGTDGTKDIIMGVDYWYDVCQEQWVETPGEAVFIVRGTADPFPRKINLVPLTKSSDTFTGPTFVLKEP